MNTKKVYEFSGNTSSTCNHSWIQIRNGLGYHKMCIRCGKIIITSGIIPEVREVPTIIKE